MFREYRKTATVKAKLFEKGDEDGMIPFRVLGINESSVFSKQIQKDSDVEPTNLVPYIETLENQKFMGKFGENYLCIGIKGERWLVEKTIFEATYELVY